MQEIQVSKAEEIHQILQEIRDFTSTAGESLYEIGLRFKKLKEIKAHKTMGFNRWDEFIHSYTNYERAWVDMLIGIADKFAPAIESATAVAVPFSRLRDALPYVKTPEDAIKWYHQAEVLPAKGWQDALKSAKGKIASDECEHPETEMWEKCRVCHAWLGKMM